MAKSLLRQRFAMMLKILYVSKWTDVSLLTLVTAVLQVDTNVKYNDKLHITTLKHHDENCEDRQQRHFRRIMPFFFCHSHYKISCKVGVTADVQLI